MISPEIFYLHIHGEQLGPYTAPQIDHLLNSGLIAEETLYWCEGLDQWQPVTSLVKLRRQRNRWLTPLLIVAILFAIGVLVQFFGSVAILGWREANQHEYTAKAAYWRARGVVRAAAFPPGTVVEFQHFSASEVEMKPPAAATVLLKGEITEHDGHEHVLSWTVPMQFDPQAREWTGESPQEVAP